MDMEWGAKLMIGYFGDLAIKADVYGRVNTRDDFGNVTTAISKVKTITGVLDSVSGNRQWIVEQGETNPAEFVFYSEYTSLKIEDVEYLLIKGNQYTITKIKNPVHINKVLEIGLRRVR
jgi:hypothetical protein